MALEAVYDTSHTHVPHEKLWVSIQDFFMKTGNYAPYTSADAVLRLHLRDATTASDTPLATRAAVIVEVDAELWDLSAKKIVFKKTYRLQTDFQTIPSAGETPNKQRFWGSEQKRASAVTEIGETLAYRLYRDIFYH